MTAPHPTLTPVPDSDQKERAPEKTVLPLNPKIPCQHEGEFVGTQCTQCGFWLFDADD